MACDARHCDSRSFIGNRNWSNAGDCAHIWRDSTTSIYGPGKQVLQLLFGSADRFVNSANLQLCHFALRRMARAGMGSYSGINDHDSRNKHRRANSDAKEVLSSNVNTNYQLDTERPRVVTDTRAIGFYRRRIEDHGSWPELFLWAGTGAARYLSRYSRADCHGVHRTFGLWQIHFFTDAESHERRDSGNQG